MVRRFDLDRAHLYEINLVRLHFKVYLGGNLWVLHIPVQNVEWQ